MFHPGYGPSIFLNIVVVLFVVQGLLCLKPSGEPQRIKLDTQGYKSFFQLHYSPDGNYAYMVAGSLTMFTKLIRVDIASGTTTEIKSSHGTTVTDYTPYYSTPTVVSWPTTHDATAYGYYYPPQVLYCII